MTHVVECFDMTTFEEVYSFVDLGAGAVFAVGVDGE